MGVIIAIVSKKEEDVAEKAVEMLRISKQNGAEAFGLASPDIIAIEESIQDLQDREINSPILVGHVFSKISVSDKPQPKRLRDGTLVFEGRIYSPNMKTSDAECVAEELNQNREEETLIRESEGSFAFAVARYGGLVAGRDSLGLYPLYWGENAQFAALASQRKALWKAGVKQVHAFPPGHIAVVDKHGFRFKLVKTLGHVKTEPVTIQTAAQKLKQLLTRSIEQRVSGLKEVAAAFSGGLDSSIVAFLAKKLEADVHLITVSLGEKAEIEHAKEAAEALKLPLHLHLYNEKDVEEVLPKVLWLIEDTNPIQAAIGIPIFWTAEMASHMGFKVILAGQGADELFGGYKRYLNGYSRFGKEFVEKTMFEDVLRMGENNFERDRKICNFHDVDLRLPFAAYQLAEFAASLPLELKIESTIDPLRKTVLRKLAENLELPHFIVKKAKKAIQYTTGVNEAVKRLSRRRGLSTQEYLQRTLQTTIEKNGLT